MFRRFTNASAGNKIKADLLVGSQEVFFMKKYFKYVINNLFVIIMVFMMAFVATTFTIKLIDDSKSYYEATFEVADIIITHLILAHHDYITHKR